MQGRWWSPATGSTDLDDVTKALLTPGDNDQLDLGASLLALHRAGAASCKAAAETPLVDELTLVSKLAEARERFAPAVVTAVGKSLGDPAYGGLLVADLANDAEHAALTLFRDAVAKGVPRPTAATRVGEVYGVPLNQLGPYRQLATDPKANAAALTDAADRALFTAVEKVVETEALEPVSKQTEDRPWVATERRVHRGQPGAGEWVRVAEAVPETEVEAAPKPSFHERLRLLAGLPAAPGAEVTEEAAIKERAAQRKAAAARRTKAAHAKVARRKRAQQVRREAAARKTPATAAASRQQAGRQQIGREQIKRRQILQVGISSRRTLPDPRHQRARGDRVGMQRVADDRGGDYTQLADRVGFWANQEQTRQVLAAAEQTPFEHRPYMIRASHLERIIGQPADVVGTAEWSQSKIELAEGEWGSGHYAEPMDRQHITREEFERHGDVGLMQRMDAMVGDDVGEYAHLTALQTEDGGVMVVQPAPVDHNDPTHRPLPRIDDWVIENGQGEIVPTRHPEVFLDLNQAYTIQVGKEYWDDEAMAIRQQYTLHPLSDAEVEGIQKDMQQAHDLSEQDRGDNVGKAERDTPWVRTEQRNELGEWVAEQAAATKPTFEERLASLLPAEEQAASDTDRRAAQRAAYQRRRREQIKRKRQTRRDRTEQQAARTPAERRQITRSQIARSQASRSQIPESQWPGGRPKVQGAKPELREDGRYAVLSPEVTRKFLKRLESADPYALIPGRTTPIPYNMHHLVNEAGDGDGYFADGLLNEYAEMVVGEFGGPVRDELAVVDGPYAEAFGLAQQILDTRPDIGQIMLDYDEKTNQYGLTAAKRPNRPIVVVELEHGMDFGDPDNPLELTFLGESHSEAMGRNLRELPSNEHVRHRPEGMFSANTMVFKLNNATVLPFRGVRVEREAEYKRKELHRSRLRDDEQG